MESLQASLLRKGWGIIMYSKSDSEYFKLSWIIGTSKGMIIAKNTQKVYLTFRILKFCCHLVVVFFIA